MKQRATRQDRIPLAAFADLIWEVPLTAATCRVRGGQIQYRTPWAVQPRNRIIVLQLGAHAFLNHPTLRT